MAGMTAPMHVAEVTPFLVDTGGSKSWLFVKVQTDTGLVRYYDVPATGDLRVGDRVRIDNGVIYRA